MEESNDTQRISYEGFPCCMVSKKVLVVESILIFIIGSILCLYLSSKWFLKAWDDLKPEKNQIIIWGVSSKLVAYYWSLISFFKSCILISGLCSGIWCHTGIFAFC